MEQREKEKCFLLSASCCQGRLWEFLLSEAAHVTPGHHFCLHREWRDHEEVTDH